MLIVKQVLLTVIIQISLQSSLLHSFPSISFPHPYMCVTIIKLITTFLHIAGETRRHLSDLSVLLI